MSNNLDGIRGPDTCRCAPNFYTRSDASGDLCQVFCEAGSTCNGNGKCSEFGSCVCNRNVLGTRCQTVLEPLASLVTTIDPSIPQTVSLGDAASLAFPPGAFSGEVSLAEFRADQLPGDMTSADALGGGGISDATFVASILEFGPEGVVFAAPVTLVMSLPRNFAPRAGKSVSAFTFDKSLATPAWKEVSGSAYDPVSKTTKSQLYHFSSYTVIEFVPPPQTPPPGAVTPSGSNSGGGGNSAVSVGGGGGGASQVPARTLGAAGTGSMMVVALVVPIVLVGLLANLFIFNQFRRKEEKREYFSTPFAFSHKTAQAHARRRLYRDNRVQADLGFPPVLSLPADLARKGVASYPVERAEAQLAAPAPQDLVLQRGLAFPSRVSGMKVRSRGNGSYLYNDSDEVASPFIAPPIALFEGGEVDGTLLEQRTAALGNGLGRERRPSRVGANSAGGASLFSHRDELTPMFSSSHSAYGMLLSPPPRTSRNMYAQ